MVEGIHRGRWRLYAGRAAVLLLAAAVWLPLLPWVYRPDIRQYRTPEGIAPKARMLGARHLAIWTNPVLRAEECRRMQGVNPEWDFMSRTFFVLALANMSLRDQSMATQACEIIDCIIDHTLAIEREKGFEHFLMAYGRGGGWKIEPPGSVFVDGEIALMLAARRLVMERPDYRIELSNRVARISARMLQGPVRSAESYPDECWLFCNTVALAALTCADALDGTDHSVLRREWVAMSRARLSDPNNGLLIAAYGVDGTPAACGPWPEGSSTWIACHMLQLVDEQFAADQYRRAKQALARSLGGFGYSREWPAGSPYSPDIDSGPVIPVLGASASASNPVGDAVMLYAMVEGPLWREVRARCR